MRTCLLGNDVVQSVANYGVNELAAPAHSLSPHSLELVVCLVAVDAVDAAGGGGGKAVKVVDVIVIVAACLLCLARLKKLVYLLR